MKLFLFHFNVRGFEERHGIFVNEPTLEVCRSLPFPLPPLDEQHAVLVNLETAMNSIVTQEQAIELSLKQSTAQRQNILRAAFAGQLVPQDPNDEPASVLVERIRVEQEKFTKRNATRKKV